MRVHLRLYVTGNTAYSQQAARNLEKLFDVQRSNQFELEVVDVLEHPELAEQDKILATPTLVKLLPRPIRKIIGDLSNRQEVIMGLDILPDNDEEDNNE